MLVVMMMMVVVVVIINFFSVPIIHTPSCMYNNKGNQAMMSKIGVRSGGGDDKVKVSSSLFCFSHLF